MTLIMWRVNILAKSYKFFPFLKEKHVNFFHVFLADIGKNLQTARIAEKNSLFCIE